MDAASIAHAFNDISDRLSRIEWMIHGASAVYAGNGRVMTRITVGSTHLIYLVKSDDRLFVPWLIAHGVFEPEVTNFFASHIHTESNCLDVGANFGYYSCLMGRLALKGKTIAIEPDPQIFELLRDNIHINWLEAEVVPIHAAVADTNHPLTLYRRLTRSGNTSIINVPPQELATHGEPPSEPFEIMATRVDDLMPAFGGRLDFLKVDVEGAEPLVFRGAKELIAANPDLKIVMEWSPGQVQAAGFEIGEFTKELAAMGLAPAVIHSAGTERISWQSLLDGPYRSGVLLTRSASLLLSSLASDGIVQNAGSDSPTERLPGVQQLSYRFTANDRRLHTEVGIRKNNSIIVTDEQEGAILYGPYISLPAGRYEAVIHFDPAVLCRGTAAMDACSDIGTNILAHKIITAEEIFGGDMSAKLQFVCQNKVSELEIRLFCTGKFSGAVRSVDILEKISDGSSQENDSPYLTTRSSGENKTRDLYSNFPTLSATNLQNAKLFANREDMISSMSFLKSGVIAEVGVAHGQFSEFLLNELTPSKFVAIDVFNMHEYPIAWGVATTALFNGMTHLDFYKRRFAGYGSRIVIEVGLSQQSLAKYPEISFDLIYIDAGHDYKNVKQDAELSTQKLKDGGIIVFNDYIMYDHIAAVLYGVVQAVNELIVYQGWQVWGFALQQHMFCDIAIRRPI